MVRRSASLKIFSGGLKRAELIGPSASEGGVSLRNQNAKLFHNADQDVDVNDLQRVAAGVGHRGEKVMDPLRRDGDSRYSPHGEDCVIALPPWRHVCPSVKLGYPVDVSLQ